MITNAQTIQIDAITIVPDFNVRSTALNQAKIAEYAENFQQLPPIQVFDVQGDLYLVNGWHRMAAALKLELKEVNIEVVGSGSRLDAIDYADQANLKHGIPLTPDQRKSVALRFVERHPDWSARKVAEIMGCSNKSVSRWIEENKSVSNDTVDVSNQNSASQSKRAGGIDVKLVVLKFKEWCNTTIRRIPVDKWPLERREKVKMELKPIVDFYQSL